VVDDSIIDVENIFRRFAKTNRSHSPGPVPVVFDASLEVGAPWSSPPFVWRWFSARAHPDRIAGSFFAPLAMSYILAILASLLVALTLTPGWLTVFDRGVGKPRAAAATHIEAVYRRCWDSSPAGRAPLSPWCWLLLGGQRGCLFLGGEFPPEFREAISSSQVSRRRAPPAAMLKMARRFPTGCSRSRASPRWNSRSAAELGEDPWGPHRSEIHVDLVDASPERSRKR